MYLEANFILFIYLIFFFRFNVSLGAPYQANKRQKKEKTQLILLIFYVCLLGISRVENVFNVCLQTFWDSSLKSLFLWTYSEESLQQPHPILSRSQLHKPEVAAVTSFSSGGSKHEKQNTSGVGGQIRDGSTWIHESHFLLIHFLPHEGGFAAVWWITEMTSLSSSVVHGKFVVIWKVNSSLTPADPMILPKCSMYADDLQLFVSAAASRHGSASVTRQAEMRFWGRTKRFCSGPTHWILVDSSGGQTEVKPKVKNNRNRKKGKKLKHAIQKTTSKVSKIYSVLDHVWKCNFTYYMVKLLNLSSRYSD